MHMSLNRKPMLGLEASTLQMYVNMNRFLIFQGELSQF